VLWVKVKSYSVRSAHFPGNIADGAFEDAPIGKVFSGSIIRMEHIARSAKLTSIERWPREWESRRKEVPIDAQFFLETPE